ncbi:protein O-mannosyl-transferase Tmtc3-like [Uloborus diversus]|uniref:protein O-mannosyl-transferase Tmtc3-like n=1 Tax=Uloborus diversus TaxID=327109 RepID=UPI00240A74FB|nr:protein O-mannosyl-transferase Tmtc3-like [Uloborus diversus]
MAFGLMVSQKDSRCTLNAIILMMYELMICGFVTDVVTNKKYETVLCYVIVVTAAGICYRNALNCGFVFDDMSAIRDNQDLRPTTPFLNLLQNDFWGTPIQKEQSHKSYRPLCVLTYRINYYFHKLAPFGYHLTNIGLHCLVCLLYMRICMMFVPKGTAFVAALLFATHPVHTEAVTGVVGRAEILSSLFFLLAFLSYSAATTSSTTTGVHWAPMFWCLLFVGMATFSKEQGITVVGVCYAYEIFIVQRVRLPELLQIIHTSKVRLWFRAGIMRTIALVSCSLFLLLVRLSIMGAQLPVFTKFDNPAAAADSPIRQLTMHYLVALNGWLLCFPCDLCCDWTMGTVSLVQSALDPRNVATFTFYGVLAALLYTCLWEDDTRSKIVLMAIAFLAFPFLPASNLFFPVGFVIAERVLYIPSMGFCMLVSYGWSLLHSKMKYKTLSWCLILFILVMFTAKTIRRNFDWQNEYTIFMAGLRVNQKNAKLYNNVGHSLESQGHHSEALEYFQVAVKVQPDDIGAHINVGRTYHHLHMYEEAEKAFRKAKDLLPRPKTGEPYQARIAPSHLNVFLNLGNLISRNGSRLEEADALYKQAISMRSDYIQAYINRGDILIRLNRTKEAQIVYETALQFDDGNPDIYYNLGVVFLEQRNAERALFYFDKALKINPEHEQALLNSAILIQESGTPEMRKVAYERLNVLLRRKQVNERVYFNLGMLAMDEKNFTLAEKWFQKAVQIREDFRSALFNLALLLSEAGRPMEAVPFLHRLLRYHPDHVKGLILLGDIYINSIRDLDAAQKCYENILSQEPENVQALHNLCVVYVERGHLQEAETCLERASALAPHERYVNDHLEIVRARRKLISPTFTDSRNNSPHQMSSEKCVNVEVKTYEKVNDLDETEDEELMQTGQNIRDEDDDGIENFEDLLESRTIVEHNDEEQPSKKRKLMDK